MRSMHRLIWPKRHICRGIELRLCNVRVVGSGAAAIRSSVVPMKVPPGSVWINGCWNEHGGRLGPPVPVRGGAGAITVPLGLVRGVEMACGGANAIPNTLAYRGA